MEFEEVGVSSLNSLSQKDICNYSGSRFTVLSSFPQSLSGNLYAVDFN